MRRLRLARFAGRCRESMIDGLAEDVLRMIGQNPLQVRVLRERRSRHSNEFRPAEFVHAVEGIDRNRNFGRAARVAA